MRPLMVLLASLLFVAPVALQAQPAQTEVTLGILAPSAAEWPLFVAESQGFFKAEGLKVTMIRGGSPPNVINAIATNSVNIAENGTDSIVAAIGRGLPLKLVAPFFTTNPYSLVTVPSVKSWEDLKGKSVILGTKQDVTAIALENMAAAHKMSLNDFSIVVGGNTPARFAALESGNVQGAMLTQPYDLLAEAKGAHILGTASDVIKEWNFTAFVVNPSWANQNKPTVVKFLRAIRKAIQYGYTHKNETVAALVEVTHADPAITAKSYDIDWTKWHAFDPNLKLSQKAVESVAAYQVKFGAIKSIPPWSQLYDGSFAAEAIK